MNTVTELIIAHGAAGRAAFGNNDFRRGPVNVDVIMLAKTSSLETSHVPRENFRFELHEPRWVKIRDQWWGQLLFLLIASLICCPIFYYNFSATIRGEIVAILSTLFATLILAKVLFDMVNVVLRRQQLFARQKRLDSIRLYNRASGD